VWVNTPTIFFDHSRIFNPENRMEDNKKRDVLVNFGKQLSALRKKKNLSFRELSNRCDVDYSDIKKYEKGEKNLTLVTIVDIAHGLGVKPKELLDYNFDFLDS
jgi:ribosome-binding protein aMBF1 (putative translation factor)